MAEFFDNTLTNNVVRKAAERLDADNVACTAVDQFQHFACQEPAFACLVADRYEVTCHHSQIFDLCRRNKVFALFKFDAGSLTEILEERNSHVAQMSGRLLGTQILSLEVIVVEAIQKEIHQIRHNSLCTFRFKQIDDVVIGHRRELNQDLTNDTNPRFLNIQSFQFIKVTDDSADIFGKLHDARISCGQRFIADLLPLFVQSICGARNLLIRSGRIQNTHKYIAINNRLYCFCQ